MILPDYIAAHLQKPFEWGTNDCICFCIGWLELETGRDYLSQYRPWDSELSAWRKIKQAGGLEVLFDANLKRIPANMAKDGNLTLIDKTVYLFSGSHAVSVGTEGLVFKSRMEATCAWSY